MPIVDAQLHEPSVSGDWADVDDAVRDRVLTEALFDALDAVGVDAAVLHPTRELAWADRTARAHPTRVANVFQADALGPEPDVAELRARGHVGVRIVLGVPRTGEPVERFRAGEHDALLAAMEAEGLPLFLMATWELPLAAEIAERHPGLTVILDHLGIPQPPTHPLDTPLFAAVDGVLELARHPNLAVKLSGAPSLSRRPFPFDDLWPHLHRYLEAFGPDRLLWGTDSSRFDGRVGFVRRADVPDAYEGRHSYGEALYFLRGTDELSEREKQAILGGTAHRLLRWPERVER